MKKMILPLIIGILLLSACQSSESKESEAKQPVKKAEQTAAATQTGTAFPYPHLLASEAKTYSLLVIGEPNEQTPIENNEKVIKDVKNILSLPTSEMVQKAYPKLEIESKAAFILFDQKGIAHQSKDLNDLTGYLAEHPAN